MTVSGKLLLLLALTGSASAALMEQRDVQDLRNIEWWKKTNFYHIYLRSFKDSDGDGNGDLGGVIGKLDYLKEIGVETLLMAPFYSSPMKDGGYDIDNYLEINPMFGTMKDFERLVKELKRRDMRIVVDFVPNHSSNKHFWFECSERALLEPERCGKYKDYYVWTDSRRFEGKYPTNWISVFGGGPAWTWSDLRQQFYLNQFLPEQPDLNFNNPAVREEFKEIARFWLRKGADGLRVDAVAHLIEDAEFRDEPLNPSYRHGTDDPFNRLLHIYTRAMHESAEVTRDWRLVTEEPEFVDAHKVIISEAYDDIDKLIEYYGNSNQDRLIHLPFNFELFNLNRNNLLADHIQRAVMRWIAPTRALGWPDEGGAMSPWIIWVTGNHDNSRLSNRLGAENVALYRWLAYLMPGVPVNYYGDELAIHDANTNSIPQRTLTEGEPSRLAFRAPIAWTGDEPVGDFSTATDIWMPLNEDWKVSNVERLLSNASDPKNELKLFVETQKLRQRHMDIFVFGDLVFFESISTKTNKVLSLGRTHEHFGSILMLANLDSVNQMTVRLGPNKSIIRERVIAPPTRGQIVWTNKIDIIRAPLIRDYAIVEIERLVLAPSHVILLKY